MSFSINDLNNATSNGIVNTSSVKKASDLSRNNSDISMNDFFKILAAQMQNQTMYDSTDTSQYMSQLVQYTTLAQVQELNAAASTSYAVSLIGKGVSLVGEDEKGNEKLITGAVDNVAFQDGTPYVCVGGEYYETSKILSVKAGN